MDKKIVSSVEYKDDIYTQISDEYKQIQQCIGMYISYHGTAAALHLFKEIFNNSLDECVNQNSPADTIEVYFNEDTGEIIVSDNGRGIPFDILRDNISKKHTSTKFGRKFNVDSAGENGVGLKVTAALSDYFSITSYRENQSKCIEVIDGNLVEHDIVNEKKSRHGTLVKFIPSKKYLGPINIKADNLCEWLRQMSYICPKGIIMKLIAQTSSSESIVKRTYEHEGLASDVQFLSQSLEVTPITLYMEQLGDNIENEMKLEMSFSYDKTIDGDLIDSYCNYVHTTEHGSHVDGCESAICNFFSKEAKKIDPNSKYEVTYEDCKKGLVLVVNCRSPQPQFGGQTKEKVNNPAIRTDARKMMTNALGHYFAGNQAQCKKIIDYLRKIAKIRIDAHAIKGIDVKKPSTWMEDADIPCFIPLADRNYKGYKELIITEGESAGGAVLLVRDPTFQAIFKLRGVVDNAFDQSLARAMKNDTLRQLVKVLGCGIGADFNIANLKWNRIIILTDGDVDGFNITSLICAFFARHMPEIITEERLYKSVPPLYSINMSNRRSKSAGREFLFDKHEYNSIFNHQVADNVSLALLYGSTENPEFKFLSNREVVSWMQLNEDYLYHLSNLSKKTACQPYILEVICWELINHPDFKEFDNGRDWRKKFKSIIENDFDELEYDIDNCSISGSYMGESVTVIVDQLFIKNAKKFISILAQNDTLFIAFRNKNEKSSDKSDPRVGMTQTSIGTFLASVNDKYSLDIEQRFKGIGEIPADLLFRSTLNPVMRKLYKITMDDTERSLEILDKIHGTNSAEERKKLIDNDRFTLEDIDN